MKVLSLFDGISCGMVALDRAGVPVEKYTAYEIEENAIKVSKHNYPQIEHKGDVFQAVYNEGEYDLLIGGSPCTYWSISGTSVKGHRETTASGVGWELFMQYVRALREAKPKYFLYENNSSMSNDIKYFITEQLGVNPIEIDSADFSAQERKRLYWTNIPFVKTWNKSPLLIRDIMIEASDHKYRSFEKYTNTVRWDKTGTRLSYDTSGKGYYSQANRCRTPNTKMNTLKAANDDQTNIYIDEGLMRLIHPIEAERLQTLPDNYTAILPSRAKRIGVCGNGWTVDVIAHILKGLIEEGE